MSEFEMSKSSVNPIATIKGIDPAIIAAAENSKAEIQARYIMAYQCPRNEEMARTKMLAHCKNKDFADTAIYSKPIGNTSVEGLSVRATEMMIREWGNIVIASHVVYEDETMRRIRVSATDLQTNANYSSDLVISKTIERKSNKGREVVSERLNTYGETVFVVKATDDELMIKEAAMLAKMRRNLGAMLIPSDIKEEIMKQCKDAIDSQIQKDPVAERRKVIDAFDSIGVQVLRLEKILGHPIAESSPAEIAKLRKIYSTIKEGTASLSDYLESNLEDGSDDSEKKKSSIKSKMQEKIDKAKENAPQTAVVEPITKSEELL